MYTHVIDMCAPRSPVPCCISCDSKLRVAKFTLWLPTTINRSIYCLTLVKRDLSSTAMKARVITLLVQAAIAAPPSEVTTEHGTLTLEGIVKRDADAYVRGSFRLPEGDGIRFLSTPDYLKIMTTDGPVAHAYRRTEATDMPLTFNCWTNRTRRSMIAPIACPSLPPSLLSR